MKKILFTSTLMLLALSTLFAVSGEESNLKSKNDSLSYIEITGKIIDSKTEDPIVFASVVLANTSIATVTNSDGEFIIKVPKNKKDGSILFTHIGYENKLIEISNLSDGKKQIALKAISLPIDEVVIRSVDALDLISEALGKVKENYTQEPEMQTAFYRETIKQNRKYVSVSEAVMDIYKSPYKTSFDADRIKIYKGRKSRDVKKMDTVIVKLQGGPKTTLLLDIVKNPGDILSREMLEYYEFKLEGITSINNREVYSISFNQILGVEYPLYTGDIYIDIKTKAFAGLDFELSERGLPYASEVLVKKKPANLDVDIKSGHYLVRYRLENDNWYLNHVRSELTLTSKWKRKLFKSDFNLMLEMAVTDRNKENIQKFTNKESAKTSDVFAEQVSSFEDGDFWGDYNTIKPDESIEVAIEKLTKKLKSRE